MSDSQLEVRSDEFSLEKTILGYVNIPVIIIQVHIFLLNQWIMIQ